MKKINYNGIMNLHKYSNNTISDDVKEVLKKAWEVRNYEIDKYWSRTLYFVGFLSAILIAYVSLKSSKDTYVNIYSIFPCEIISKTDSNKPLYIVLMGLGSFISYIWYLVNRGSKFWQENWENHIDYLEKKLGVPPLYGTLIFNDCKFTNLLKAYPISPSKANILVSLVIFICFLLAFIGEIFGNIIQGCIGFITFIIFVLFMIFLHKILQTSCLKNVKDMEEKKKYILYRGRDKSIEHGLHELDDN